jgi:hypothetical protein
VGIFPEQLAAPTTAFGKSRIGTTVRNAAGQANDWGHLGTLDRETQERKLWAFTITMGYSRRMMVEVALHRRSARCRGCTNNRLVRWAVPDLFPLRLSQQQTVLRDRFPEFA